MRMSRFGKKESGFSLVEAIVVVAIILLLAAITGPNILQAVRMARLRSAAADLAGLMQDARILASKSNNIIEIQFTTTIGGLSAAYVDPSGANGAYLPGYPVVAFSRGVTPATAAPDGTMGSPTSQYSMSTDTASTATVVPGSTVPGSTVMAFSKRGLPCDYTSGVCLTPSSTYFVYYLSSPNGWIAVVVTRAGRTRVSLWNGSAWSN